MKVVCSSGLSLSLSPTNFLCIYATVMTPLILNGSAGIRGSSVMHAVTDADQQHRSVSKPHVRRGLNGVAKCVLLFLVGWWCERMVNDVSDIVQL